jgi:hypothetical protein
VSKEIDCFFRRAQRKYQELIEESMYLRKKKHSKPGQSILEYTVIIAIVVTALMIMQVYLKRGIQAATKAAADQLSSQSTPEITNLEKGGYLFGSNVSSLGAGTKNVRTGFLNSGGMDMRKLSDETTTTNASSFYNLGNVNPDD